VALGSATIVVNVRNDSSMMKILENVFSSKFAKHIVRILSVYVQISNVFQVTASAPDARYVTHPSKPAITATVNVQQALTSSMSQE